MAKLKIQRLLDEEMQLKNLFRVNGLVLGEYLDPDAFVDIDIFIKNVEIGVTNLTTTELATIKFLDGFTTPPDMIIEFYCDNQFKVYNGILKWREGFFDSTKKQFKVIPQEAGYKYRNCTIDYLTVDQFNPLSITSGIINALSPLAGKGGSISFDEVAKVSKTYELRGLFPKEISNPILNEEEGDVLTFTAVFSVETVKISDIG